MELNEHGFLEEFLELRRETLQTFPAGINDSHQFTHDGSASFSYFSEYPSSAIQPISSIKGFPMPTEEPGFSYGFNGGYYPFEEELSTQSTVVDTSYVKHGALPFLSTEDNGLVTGNVESELFPDDLRNILGEKQSKVELFPPTEIPTKLNRNLCKERKSRVKKIEGQPSKNLMAERRRRKRLNDRLSMLRSVVPKISKMDRTSIVGDTIEYMKELLEKIKNLQNETQVGSDQLSRMGIFKDLKQNEMINSPKFDVERRRNDTRVEVCCAGKPGLLLSTVTAIETLGLEIQQCVISSFNDFSMQASCSEVLEHGPMLSAGEIKQILIRNAGYGGKCG
ncbi:transcription factor bHLH93-like [Papaver somniferum]|uniref:transcription factor bHLH93-like n=1 Tax=Papaver somniferum TaxID=3469 RepID=UPI000E6FEB06|nr:transcription factor bHLH93-like [Papaver somniferum]